MVSIDSSLGFRALCLLHHLFHIGEDFSVHIIFIVYYSLTNFIFKDLDDSLKSTNAEWWFSDC